MNRILIILSILIFSSCKTDRYHYHADGTKSTFFTKDSLTIETIYYPNGKIKKKKNLINGYLEGWTVIYDSVNSNKIEEIYFIHSQVYTDIRYNKDRCKYFYIKPYIPINADTIYISNIINMDSIPVLFFKRDSLVHFDNYIVTNRLIVNKKAENYIYVIDSFRNKFYIHYDDTSWYVKGFKLKLEVKAAKFSNIKLCCCDSIVTATTSKIIVIK